MTERKSRVSRPVDVTVGQNLKEIRRQRGLSQQAIAEALDVSFQQVQKYEKGSNRISAGVLWELSLMLDVPVEMFFSGLVRDAETKLTQDDQRPLLSAEAYKLAVMIETCANPEIKKAVTGLLATMSGDKRDDAGKTIE